jgi:trehalose 2-sulfotransferase
MRLGLLPRPADRGYMICATPRSGSNYLCQLLASTGKLGNSLEFLNMAGGERYADPDRPPKPRRQLAVIRTTGATGNGIYAVKLLPSNYLFARRKIDLFSELPNLKVVRLRRRDLLGQAISLSRVRQTGQFMSSYPSTAEATYSEHRIAAARKRCRDRKSCGMTSFGTRACSRSSSIMKM